jgi:hypothetical protein
VRVSTEPMIFKIEPRMHCHLVKLCALAEIDVFQ